MKLDCMKKQRGRSGTRLLFNTKTKGLPSYDIVAPSFSVSNAAACPQLPTTHLIRLALVDALDGASPTS
jgi:hypothetical protein